MTLGADGMVEFPDLTEAELDFRDLLCSPRRLRAFAEDCRRQRESSGEAARDRKQYATLAARKGW